jgi:DNA-binding beta-propeller fold protein YncE
MVFDPSNGFLYVSYGNANESGVSVINGSTNIANLTFGSGSSTNTVVPLLYDQSNHLVYAEGISGKEVAIINGSTVMGTLPTSFTLCTPYCNSNPAIFGFDSFNGLVYLIQNGGGITIINGTSEVGHLNGGCGDISDCVMAIDPSNGVAYIPNTKANTTSVINGTSLISAVQMGGSPGAALFDPANGLVYVTIENYNYGDKVAVISGSKLATTITVGTAPERLFYDPTNGYVYVSLYNPETISVIDGTTNLASVHVGFAGIAPIYDPSTGYVYYPNQMDGVTVFNGTKVIGTVHTGVAPNFALFNPSNGLVYVSNPSAVYLCNGCGSEPSDIVSLIRGTSFIENVTVGQSPWYMTFDSVRNWVDVLVANGVSEIYPSNSSTTSTTSSSSSSETSLTTSSTASTTTTTSTSLVSNTSVASSSTLSTSITSSTSTETEGGGVPEFPFQVFAVTAFVTLIVVSYLLIGRRRAGGRDCPLLPSSLG